MSEWTTRKHPLRGFRRRIVAVAHAHTGTQSYIWVVLKRLQVDGQIHFPIADLSEVLGLAIPDNADLAGTAVEANISVIHRYASEHFSISNGTQKQAIDFEHPRVFSEGEGSYLALSYKLIKDMRPSPSELAVSFDGIIAAKPHHDAVLIFLSSRGWGRFRKWNERRFAFDSSTDTHVVSVETPTLSQDLTATIGELLRRIPGFLRGIPKRLGLGADSAR